ncbi:MAG TPA: globin family protein [Burkholderiales bacterium]|jgi:hemoglobin-like flavoprotein
MTPQQVALVQSSFDSIKPIADTAAHLFYERLFAVAPEYRRLFSGNMARQGRMLMNMIGIAVSGLSRPETVLLAVKDLGRRHAAYGLQEKDYQVVGGVLLWTLERGLGMAFTAEVKEAWATAYGLLANVMQQGVREAVPLRQAA